MFPGTHVLDFLLVQQLLVVFERIVVFAFLGGAGP